MTTHTTPGASHAPTNAGETDSLIIELQGARLLTAGLQIDLRNLRAQLAAERAAVKVLREAGEALRECLVSQLPLEDVPDEVWLPFCAALSATADRGKTK